MAVLFKLSEAVAIGLHAAMFLAVDQNQSATASQIARTFSVSEAHLVKVLQMLSRAGLIEATRGRGGGYCLARPAQDIRLLDIVQAIEGTLEVQHCLLRHPICHNRKCILGPLVRNINSQTLDYLKKHTVAELAATLAASEPKKNGEVIQRRIKVT